MRCSVPSFPCLVLSVAMALSGCTGAITPNSSEQPILEVFAERGPQVEDDSSNLPGRDNPIVRKLLAQNIDIAGEWENFSCFWGSRTLTIEGDADSAGAYHLHYTQRLDLGDLEYHRTAKFENGVVTLDEPVCEFGMKGSKSPYTILYVLQSDRGNFIIPSVNAETMKSPGELGQFFAYKRMASPR